MYPPSRPAPGEKSSALMLPECPCIVVRRHRMFGRCSLRLNASRWNSSVSLCSSARLDEQSPKANSSTVPLPHLNFDMSPSPLSCSRHPLMQRSLLPDMIALPSGAHRQQLTICMWPWRIARHSPLDTLQIRTAFCAQEEGQCTSNVLRPSTLQRFDVQVGTRGGRAGTAVTLTLSFDEVHIRVQSGEKSQPDTTCSCPVPIPPPVRFLGHDPITEIH
mmetsp:Transcript_25230/g.61223  ORF Transcript_25230/g.61223 Transcript_25230/m.61223 type:complete len:218 (-) Transcript_25230:255-908(-)